LKQVSLETNKGYFLGISSFTAAAMAVPMVITSSMKHYLLPCTYH